MMTRILLICILIITSVTLNAQTSYQITNSVTLKNQDCELTKTTIILPVPQNNNYQEIANFTNGKDYTTCDIAKHILAEEEEHEQDLQDYLTDIARMKESFLKK